MSEFPNALLQGLELLNRGEYFEAHEAIEAAWRAEPGEIRRPLPGDIAGGCGLSPCYSP